MNFRCQVRGHSHEIGPVALLALGDALHEGSFAGLTGRVFDI